MRRHGFAHEEGQMVVELAIVLPVILAVMVIAVDSMVYLRECARFDQVAPQRVLACATSPSKEAYEQDVRMQHVQEALRADFSGRGQEVSVECEPAQASFSSATVFRCTLQMTPWPLSQGGATVFGMHVPVHLEHECALAVDPYTPGQL